MIGELEVVVRLVISAIIGGLIGLERELNNRPAGLRTHVLVIVGAALVMLVSKYGFMENSNADPGRLAAQVISGIGFLGAGTIIMQGNIVHGLTTAASLWTSACIGLAIGAGYYIGGIASAIIVMFTLIFLRVFENSVFKKRFKVLNVIASERPGLIGEIGNTFARHSILIKHVNIKSKKRMEDTCVHIEFVLKTVKKSDCNRVLEEVNDIKEVHSTYWEE